MAASVLFARVAVWGRRRQRTRVGAIIRFYLLRNTVKAQQKGGATLREGRHFF